jgi:Domain of unknown function (DUF4296)
MLKRIALIGIVFLFSCGDKNGIPSGIIKPAKMQLVLFDVLRAEAFVFDFVKKDTAKIPEAENAKLQQQIFSVHKVSKEQFYNSYDFYKAHPDLMQPLLDSMINRATREKYRNTRSGNSPVAPTPQADTSIGKAMRDKYSNNQLSNNSDTPVIQRKLFKKKARRFKRTLNVK